MAKKHEVRRLAVELQQQKPLTLDEQIAKAKDKLIEAHIPLNNGKEGGAWNVRYAAAAVIELFKIDRTQPCWMPSYAAVLMAIDQRLNTKKTLSDGLLKLQRDTNHELDNLEKGYWPRGFSAPGVNELVDFYRASIDLEKELIFQAKELGMPQTFLPKCSVGYVEPETVAAIAQLPDAPAEAGVQS